MVDINDFGSLVMSSKCYEHLQDMNEMNDSMLWAEGSRCYD